ncbi:hypothetical protein HZA97_02805 [Candidatus Woesearchaeota archaeon]|nr:hypothetical protein [Candidatus Woesearchaeota archaeon]
MNSENLEIKVGEIFEVQGIGLPLVGETELLRLELDYDSAGIKLLNTAQNKKLEGRIYNNFYTFQALKEGYHNINFYYVNFISNKKWTPNEQSSFYGRHEKIIKVKISA